MKFENSNGHTKDWSDVNHNAEQRKVLPGRMSYITVTENAIKWWVTVNGLNHHEVSKIFMNIIHHLSSGLILCPQTRLLSEKVSDQPETHDDKDKVVEFSIPSWQVVKNQFERDRGHLIFPL